MSPEEKDMRKKSSSATAKKATPKTRTIVTRGSSTERISSSKTKQKESIIFEGLPKSVLSGKNCLVCKELFVNIDMNFVQCTFCQQNVHLKCCMSAELFESFSEFQNKIDNINLFSGKIGYSCENCSKIASPTVADMSTQSDPDTGLKENDLKESHENKNEDLVQEISTSQTILKENTEMEKNREAKICSFYQRGTCRYGGNGKKSVDGKICRFSHPRKCNRFCKFGTSQMGGCVNAACKFLHPFLCSSSIKFGDCSKPDCTL